jgi:hypothetical protein
MGFKTILKRGALTTLFMIAAGALAQDSDIQPIQDPVLLSRANKAIEALLDPSAPNKAVSGFDCVNDEPNSFHAYRQQGIRALPANSPPSFWLRDPSPVTPDEVVQIMPGGSLVHHNFYLPRSGFSKPLSKRSYEPI